MKGGHFHIAVVGGRDFENFNLLDDTVSRVIRGWDVWQTAVIVSGGAYGADKLAERFAAKHSLPTIIHLPDWNKHGKGAAFIRNLQIVLSADIVVAFWDRQSKGTADTITKAQEHGKPVVIVTYPATAKGLFR